MSTFKPMLAASMDADKGQTLETLSYPLMASPKLDGIRCVVRDGKLLSRSLKPIQNRYINSVLGRKIKYLEGLDGELMVAGSFQDVTSGVMSRDGEPDFKFMVFDWFKYPEVFYEGRVIGYEGSVNDSGLVEVEALSVKRCHNADTLSNLLGGWLAAGYEGAIVRDPFGEYKFGRSTWREQGMVKVKPFEDAEANVIGFEEQCANTNEATTNELGRTARSSAKEGKVGKDTLGALVVRNKEFGIFRVGTGMDDATRKLIWANKRKYLGKVVTFRFQRIGTKDKPRIPSFKGFRHEHDL